MRSERTRTENRNGNWHESTSVPSRQSGESKLTAHTRMLKMAWKDVNGFEGYYEVSDVGEVRNSKRGTLLTPRRHRNGGHLRVRLQKNGVAVEAWIHRLVLEAFAEPRPTGMVCRHLDGNPENNCVENLCWGTLSENQHDRKTHGTMALAEQHPNSKLSNNQVREIRTRVAYGEQKQTLAKEFGLSDVAIGKLVRRKTYRSVV